MHSIHEAHEYAKEFEMPHDEAFLLLECYVASMVPLCISVEDVSSELNITREQAYEEMINFAKIFESDVEWKIFLNGQIGFRVGPSFLEKINKVSSKKNRGGLQ